MFFEYQQPETNPVSDMQPNLLMKISNQHDNFFSNKDSFTTKFSK